MKLLLVEDEKKLSDALIKGLKSAGYAVDAAYDGKEALEQLAANEYDLLILDLQLPKVDGFEVLRELRKNDPKTKVLILSARGGIEDRVHGLDEGANDYLTKPFDLRELKARIRNLLRMEFVSRPSILTFRDLTLDTRSKIVRYKEKTIPLTRKEYGILEYMMIHPTVTVSAEMLMEHVWQSDFDPFSNTIRYHMHSLKKS